VVEPRTFVAGSEFWWKDSSFFPVLSAPRFLSGTIQVVFSLRLFREFITFFFKQTLIPRFTDLSLTDARTQNSFVVNTLCKFLQIKLSLKNPHGAPCLIRRPFFVPITLDRLKKNFKHCFSYKASEENTFHKIWQLNLLKWLYVRK